MLEIIQDILVDMDEKNEKLNFNRFHKKIIDFKMENELENVSEIAYLIFILFSFLNKIRISKSHPIWIKKKQTKDMFRYHLIFLL